MVFDPVPVRSSRYVWVSKCKGIGSSLEKISLMKAERAMQDLCDQLMSPVSHSLSYTEWMQAVDAIDSARDLAQVTRCGKASLMQVSERLQQWKTGGEGEGRPKDRSKEKLLTDCCHTFIEHCAEIVEMSGATPKLASNLLGASIRMAEVVGKTGLLLCAMESEFAQLSDKVSRIELVYEVAVKRVELVAGEIAQLQKQADSAGARAEMALKRESQLKLQCQELKRSLQRQTTNRNDRSPKRDKRVADRSPAKGSNFSVSGKGHDSSGQRTPRSDLETPDQTPVMRSRLSGGQGYPGLVQRDVGHVGPHLPNGHGGFYSEAGDTSGEFAQTPMGNVPTSTHSPSATLKSVPLSRSGPPESMSSMWQDPLEGAVQAAFDHLQTLLQQVEDIHRISHPVASFLASTSSTSSLKGLNLVSMAGAIHSWVDSSLKFQDPVLATSVKQSASHLQCLASLLNGQSRSS